MSDLAAAHPVSTPSIPGRPTSSLPVFGFANAGVPWRGSRRGCSSNPVTLGLALGLFVGKQIGVFGLVIAAVKLGLAQRPAQYGMAGWWQGLRVTLLCGVGFTMSLFIGLLAFATRGA